MMENDSGLIAKQKRCMDNCIIKQTWAIEEHATRHEQLKVLYGAILKQYEISEGIQDDETFDKFARLREIGKNMDKRVIEITPKGNSSSSWLGGDSKGSRVKQEEGTQEQDAGQRGTQEQQAQAAAYQESQEIGIEEEKDWSVRIF